MIKNNILGNAKKMEHKDEFIEFLTFINESDIKHSKNNNGTFIDLNSLNTETLISIDSKLTDILSKKIEKVYQKT